MLRNVICCLYPTLLSDCTLLFACDKGLMCALSDKIVLGKHTTNAFGQQGLVSGAIVIPTNRMYLMMKEFTSFVEQAYRENLAADEEIEKVIVPPEKCWRISLVLTANGLDIQRQWKPSIDIVYQERLARGERIYRNAIAMEEWRRTAANSILLGTVSSPTLSRQ